MNDRKNHELLVKGFASAFGNRTDVKLKLNSKGQEDDVLASLQKWLEETKITNIELNLTRLPEAEYLNFMQSLDCYVNVAKGEGFAIPPREALALGIPCLLADNTAQQTLCRSGYVRPIASQIREPAWLEIYLQYHGEWFNSKVEDVAAGFVDVYENYPSYLQQAHQGREWVKKYLPENLKRRYLNLAKPQKLILGDRDEVTDDYLMTTSSNLYQKYLSLEKQRNPSSSTKTPSSPDGVIPK
jgi:glycosyltransferase involved in cell wall biosynthesis